MFDMFDMFACTEYLLYGVYSYTINSFQGQVATLGNWGFQLKIPRVRENGGDADADPCEAPTKSKVGKSGFVGGQLISDVFQSFAGYLILAITAYGAGRHGTGERNRLQESRLKAESSRPEYSLARFFGKGKRTFAS